MEVDEKQEKIVEWDKMIFTSYVSVSGEIQSLIIDKDASELTVGYVDEVERIAIKVNINEVKTLFQNMNLFAWPKSTYHLGADGERWEFVFFNRGELILTKSGANAYPAGYEVWYSYFRDLISATGRTKIISCYHKEREGTIDWE